MRILVCWVFLATVACAEQLNWNNDEEVQNYLSRVGSQMVEKKGLTTRATLVSQLQRKQCHLALPATHDVVRDPVELYTRSRPGVLMVAGLYKCKKCGQYHAILSSGFVLKRNGVAASNYHVFTSTDPEAFVAMTSDGRIYPIKEVLAADEADDVAIFQLDLPDGVNLMPLPLAGNREPAVSDEALAPVGTPVCVISHPERLCYALTTGVISRYMDNRSRNESTNTVRRVAITADFAGGSSGAPVLNPRGEVVAIVTATHSVYTVNHDGKQEQQMTLKLCIPVNRLRALMQP